jgi:MYXO-CTERM domain-containing protein
MACAAIVVAGCGFHPASVSDGGVDPVDAFEIDAPLPPVTCGALTCDPHAVCMETPTAHCACASGFTGDGMTCTDIDECATANGGCDAHATCANTTGSRACTCDTGYVGDGITCNVADCSVANGGCDANATCAVSGATRTCTCNTGYTGDGITCADVDECGAANGGCDPNATCTNTPGSHACICNDGFTGDGQTCTPPPQAGGCGCSADGSGSLSTFGAAGIVLLVFRRRRRAFTR